MGIGLGILLIAIGAVLTFAVTADLPFIAVETLGIILMIVGVIALIAAFVYNQQRAHTSHTSRVEERRIEEP